MVKTLAEMPLAPAAEMDRMSWAVPALLARRAQEAGPALRRVVRQGPLAGREVIYLIGPEANRFVLHTHREYFSHALGWTPVMGEIMGVGLLNMDEPEHARHRKLWNPAFTSAYTETYLPLLEEVISRHTASWLERGEVDIYDEVRAITFAVAATALAGAPQGPEVARLQKLFYTLLFGSGAASAASYQESRAEALRARDALREILLGLIAARRAQPAGVRPGDVLSLIVHARDETGAALTDAQVLGHLNILLVAGHETIAMLSAWTLYLLATLPEQRARVRAELDAAVGPRHGPISAEVLRGLKTLDLFIRETGRLHPPAYHLPRGVLRDVEFAGYLIPAGTAVQLAVAASHLLPAVFADPARFDPDRFAPPREEDKRTPYSLITFGGGPRLCIGINFANIEVRHLAVHVLRHLRLAPVYPHPPVQAGAINTVLVGGLPMRVTARAG